MKKHCFIWKYGIIFTWICTDIRVSTYWKLEVLETWGNAGSTSDTHHWHIAKPLENVPQNTNSWNSTKVKGFNIFENIYSKLGHCPNHITYNHTFIKKNYFLHITICGATKMYMIYNLNFSFVFFCGSFKNLHRKQNILSSY